MEQVDEESEIAEAFSSLLRQGLGSGMQLGETQYRMSLGRRQQLERGWAERQRTGAAVANSHHAKLAMGLRLQLTDPSFFRESTSEQIADAMTVAGELAPQHADAQRAFFAGQKVLEQGNISLAAIHRDHPDRFEAHQALINAIDDSRAAFREAAEAAAARDREELNEAIARENGIDVVDVPNFLDAHRAALQDSPAVTDTPNEEEAQQAHEEARVAADEVEEHLDREAEHLEDADHEEDRARRVGDRVEAHEAEEETYRRFTVEEREKVAEVNPTGAEVRARQSASFARPTQERVNGKKPRASKPKGSKTPPKRRGRTSEHTR